MATWGATTFNIRWGSFVPPETDDSTKIIDILAKKDDLSAIAQALQQSGRKRKQTSFTVVVTPADLTFHDALQVDKDEGTVRTFTGPLGVTLDCIVLSVGRVDYKGGVGVPGAVFFPVTFLEATDI